jgi:hypothetical protein
MAQLTFPRPARPGRFRSGCGWRCSPIVAPVTLVGLWVSPGVITNDFAISRVLSVVWFGVAGLVALALAW